MIKKNLLISAAVLVALFLGYGVVWAASNNVRFAAPTNLNLTDPNGTTVPLTVASSSNVASFSMSATQIVIGLENGSGITISSTGKRAFSDTLLLGTLGCSSSATSTYTISASATQTTTVSIGDVCMYGLSATVNSPNQVTLSWSGSSTAYTVSNLTNNTNAQATVSNSVLTGLACNTTYSFSVVGTTGSASSNAVTTTATTDKCTGSPIVVPSGGGGGGGAATPTPTVTPTPTPATPSAPTVSPKPVETTPVVVLATPKIKDLKPGSRGADVLALQAKLKVLGYLSKSLKPVDNYGPATAAAVKKFQKANKLPMNGVFNGKTAALMNASGNDTAPAAPTSASVSLSPALSPLPTPSVFKDLRPGSRGASVIALQEKLKALGFLSPLVKSVDNYGSATAAAVKKFQNANKISQTGSIGPLTLTALEKL